MKSKSNAKDDLIAECEADLARQLAQPKHLQSKSAIRAAEQRLKEARGITPRSEGR
jgi:hypothetical protein